MCDRHPWGEPAGPTCTRSDAHAPGHGCTFESGDGSSADDTKKTEKGHG